MDIPLLEPTTGNYFYFTRFTEGDEKALAFFYKQAFPRLLNYAARFTNDHFDASTIVQEAILKAWECRAKMESMHHIYYFTRLNIKWRSYRHYNSSKQKFRTANILPLDDNPCADEFLCMAWHNAQQECSDAAKEKNDLLQKALGHLPVARRQFVQLYFTQNLAVSLIADRYKSSNYYIVDEIRKALKYLRQEMNGLTKPDPPALPFNKDMQQVEAPLKEILRLRLEKEWSFSEIAEHLQLPPAEVLKQYLTARQQLKKIQTKPRGKQYHSYA